MRIAVLGSSGFVGSHVLDILVSARIETLGIDVAPPRWAQPAEAMSIDITNGDALRSALHSYRPDAVVNAAGLLGTSETFDHPNETISCNLIGSMNALLASMALPAHYILLDTGTRWPNPYSVSKRGAADLATAYSRELSARVTILKLFNLYGPRQSGTGRVRKIIPYFVDRALRGEPLPIFGSGDQIVDLVHAADCAFAVLQTVVRAPGDGEVIEVGSGQPRTVLEVAHRVIDEIGAGDVKFVGERRGEGDAHPVADLRACREILGFTPEPSLDRLRTTVAWIRANGVSWEAESSFDQPETTSERSDALADRRTFATESARDDR